MIYRYLTLFFFLHIIYKFPVSTALLLIEKLCDRILKKRKAKLHLKRPKIKYLSWQSWDITQLPPPPPAPHSHTHTRTLLHYDLSDTTIKDWLWAQLTYLFLCCSARRSNDQPLIFSLFSIFFPPPFEKKRGREAFGRFNGQIKATALKNVIWQSERQPRLFYFFYWS